MTIFKVGDRVRLLRNNSCGGLEHGRYGKKDECGIIVRKGGERADGVGIYRVFFDVSKEWTAYDIDLTFEEHQYDPTQVGDTEDDI
jgi:hypothetical protein